MENPFSIADRQQYIYDICLALGKSKEDCHILYYSDDEKDTSKHRRSLSFDRKSTRDVRKRRSENNHREHSRIEASSKDNRHPDNPGYSTKNRLERRDSSRRRNDRHRERSSRRNRSRNYHNKPRSKMRNARSPDVRSRDKRRSEGRDRQNDKSYEKEVKVINKGDRENASEKEQGELKVTRQSSRLIFKKWRNDAF